MGNTGEKVRRYRIIDKRLHGGGRVKSRDLAIACGGDVTTRTINADIKEMKEDPNLGYFAPIEYDKGSQAYYYSNSNYTLSQFSLNDKEVESLQLAVDLLDVFKEKGLLREFAGLIDKIKVMSGDDGNWSGEGRKTMLPEGSVSLRGIEQLRRLHAAIVEEQKIELTYKRFDQPEAGKRVVRPYCLKEFWSFWYLVGYCEEKEESRIFALDRIEDFELLEEWFSGEEFDTEAFFADRYGVSGGGTEAVEVRLWFSPDQAHYIRALPLHHSQRVEQDDDRGLVVSIFVRPTYELYMKLLGYGEEVEVLEPKMVREDLAEKLEAALRRY